MRDAQRELLKAQTMSQMMIEKARVESKMADQLVILQEKMLDVAKKRIEIIKAGSLPIIREIESFTLIGDETVARNSEMMIIYAYIFCEKK